MLPIVALPVLRYRGDQARAHKPLILEYGKVGICRLLVDFGRFWRENRAERYLALLLLVSNFARRVHDERINKFA